MNQTMILLQCNVGRRRIQFADLQPSTEITMLAPFQCRDGLACYEKTVLQVFVLGRTGSELDKEDFENAKISSHMPNAIAIRLALQIDGKVCRFREVMG